MELYLLLPEPLTEHQRRVALIPPLFVTSHNMCNNRTALNRYFGDV